MSYITIHKEIDKTSFFYVDWHDWSNIVGIIVAVGLFVFGFIYIFKALGFF